MGWPQHDRATFLSSCLDLAEAQRAAGDERGAKISLRRFYMVRYLDRDPSSYMGYVETLAFERWLTADQGIAARARAGGIN